MGRYWFINLTTLSSGGTLARTTGFAFFITLFLASSASAQGVQIYGVGNSPNIGGNDAIFAYSTLTSAPTLLVDVPDSNPTLNNINGLATDSARNRLLMIRDGAGGGGNNLYQFDLGTNTFSNLGAISTSIFIGNSGGGGMYNGSYYYWDDTGGSQGLVRVDFNPDGSISASTALLAASWGDFGDLTIDSSGILYATSQEGGNFNLWTLDLNNIGAGRSFTSQGSNVPYQQIAFDPNGNLIGVDLQGAGTRLWYTIDPSNGSILSQTARQFYAGDTPIYDLSTGIGLTPVPEPGTIGMLSLAALAGLVWHRRRKSPPVV